jgi:hypothetical protein
MHIAGSLKSEDVNTEAGELELLRFITRKRLEKTLYKCSHC